ncbi:MAG: glycosyltransferase N-terminal domain-containing protein, partial [Verrucomicrobiota bacterium]
VSVGEVLIALKLAQKMRTLRTDLNIVLSTTTTTGFALAGKSSADWLEVIYNPIDFPPFLNSALKLIQPVRIILVEAEVWPNLAVSARKRGIPVALVNARLSPRSESRFRRFRFFTAPIFQLLDLIGVQEPEDIGRWKSLGLDEARLQLTGSIKFDQSGTGPARVDEFHALLALLGMKPDAPVLLAGSTFPGEEKILAQIVLELRPQFPDLFLIVVPRHIERTPEVVADIQSTGLACALRKETGAQAGRKIDCLVVNTTGELRDWYYVGTVIFIGKSLTAIGGQNPVEAVVAGKPVLFGPHMENFRVVVEQWLTQGAAIQVADADALKVQIARLLSDPQLRQTMSANALTAVATHQGATARTAELLLAS